jgi:hypothetical protein
MFLAANIGFFDNGEELSGKVEKTVPSKWLSKIKVAPL